MPADPQPEDGKSWYIRVSSTRAPGLSCTVMLTPTMFARSVPFRFACSASNGSAVASVMKSTLLSVTAAIVAEASTLPAWLATVYVIGPPQAAKEFDRAGTEIVAKRPSPIFE